MSTRVIDIRVGQGLCFPYGAVLSGLLILLVGSLLINALNENVSSWIDDVYSYW